MELIVPDYYRRFKCIASACPDSCCKEWAVDVDDIAAARYRALSGALGDRLRQVLQDTEDGTVMSIENGRCPMWRDDGLCRIQAELGHEALCQVCRDFPRLRHDYGEIVELGLELSCPEAARLILSAETDAVSVTHGAEGAPADDPEILAILRRSRDEALAFLERSTYPPPHTLAVLLLYAHDVQSEIDGDIPAVMVPDALLTEARKYAGSGDMSLLFSFFANLEILTPQWKVLLEAGPSCPVWSVQILRFARYLIRRYWLQAVADLDLICRVKFIIIACLMVASIRGNVIDTAQLFSKEIENNPDNVDAILDGAYAASALTDIQLLGLLFAP